MEHSLPMRDLPQIHGAPSYWLRAEKVELYVSAEGGHLAPVQFKLKHRWVNPYSLAPWEPAEVPASMLPLLRVLRGDFFCLPFGTSDKYKVHGDTANLTWKLIDRNPRKLTMAMDLKQFSGKVVKTIFLEDNHRAVYQEHVITGVKGRYPYGHHAILEVPEGATALINTSPFVFGQVAEDFTNPVIGEYNSLQPRAPFESLDNVPLATGGTTSLHEYPDREGFEDLVMVSSAPGLLAWTAVTMDGYVWFSLKSPKTLPSTVFWFSNGGRHQEPWRGRHRRRVGLEETCSFFAGPLELARKAPLGPIEVPTCGAFSTRSATTVRLIQGVYPVSAEFGMVVSISPVEDADEVTIVGESGESVNVPLNWRYVLGS